MAHYLISCFFSRKKKHININNGPAVIYNKCLKITVNNNDGSK